MKVLSVSQMFAPVILEIQLVTPIATEMVTKTFHGDVVKRTMLNNAEIVTLGTDLLI